MTAQLPPLAPHSDVAFLTYDVIDPGVNWPITHRTEPSLAGFPSGRTNRMESAMDEAQVSRQQADYSSRVTHISEIHVFSRTTHGRLAEVDARIVYGEAAVRKILLRMIGQLIIETTFMAYPAAERSPSSAVVTGYSHVHVLQPGSKSESGAGGTAP